MFTSREVADGELAAHHNLVLETEGPHGTWRTIRSPLRFDGERQSEIVAPPVLGADNAEVLGRD
jgi:crotonobetainyl-CoA:carnitine CoA-transferase CaiB-like acyl-CoA transferase